MRQSKLTFDFNTLFDDFASDARSYSSMNSFGMRAYRRAPACGEPNTAGRRYASGSVWNIREKSQVACASLMIDETRLLRCPLWYIAT